MTEYQRNKCQRVESIDIYVSSLCALKVKKLYYFDNIIELIYYALINYNKIFKLMNNIYYTL